MNFAHLDDGRRVIVDSSKEQTRSVGGKNHFLSDAHVTVLLDGGWQTVRRHRLKSADYGNPFRELK